MTFSSFSVFAGPGRTSRPGKLPAGYSPLGDLGRHYDPYQPRVPAGHREGGQWTRGWDGSDAPASRAKSRTAAYRRPRAADLVRAGYASDAPGGWKLGAQYAANEDAGLQPDISQSERQPEIPAPDPGADVGPSIGQLIAPVADWLDTPAGVGSGPFMVPGTGTGSLSPEIISANPMDYRPEYHDRPITRGDIVGAGLDLAYLVSSLGVLARLAAAAPRAGITGVLRVAKFTEEPWHTQALGSAGKFTFHPAQADIDRAAFKAVVGKAKYEPGGKPVKTIYDAVTGDGLAEIKTGRSRLSSSYQLRLQTYGALVNNRPYTIYTSRPINPAFNDWLARWGVAVKPLPDRWWWLR